MAAAMANMTDNSPFNFAPSNSIFASEELPGTFNKNLRPAIEERGTSIRYEESPSVGSLEDDEYEGMDYDVGGHLADNESLEGERDRSVDITSSKIKRSASTPSSNLKIMTRNEHNSIPGRVVGGRPAVPKIVTENLDSDDEIIKDMKDRGMKDKVVRGRLIEEGRTRYDEKTIATRYVRILKVFDKGAQARCEENFSDYHEDEDHSLIEAHEETEEWFQKHLAFLEEKRWKAVADMVEKKINRKKYSRNICRERYGHLIEGTGQVPFELDPNSEERRASTGARVQARIQMRIDAEEATRREAQAKIDAKIKAKVLEDEFKNRKAVERAAKRAKSKALEDGRKANVAVIKKRAQDKRNTKAARAAKLQKNKEEMERKNIADKQQGILLKQQEAADKARRIAQEKLDKARREHKAQLEKMDKLRSDSVLKEIMRRRIRAKVTTGIASASESSFDFTGSLAARQSTMTEPNVVSSPTSTRQRQRSDNPRQDMTSESLRLLLKSRNLLVNGNKEQRLSRIADHDEILPITDLKKELMRRKMKLSGTRAKLLERIAQDDVARSHSLVNFGHKNKNKKAELSGASSSSDNAFAEPMEDVKGSGGIIDGPEGFGQITFHL